MQIKIGLLIETADAGLFPTAIKLNSFNSIFENDLQSFYLFNEIDQVLSALEKNLINGLIIDIFDLGIDKSIKLIEEIRKEYSHVPMCIFGTKQQILELPNVPATWKNRFSHYYKLAKDSDQQTFKVSLKQVIKLMELYLQDHLATKGLKEIRNVLIKKLEPENDILVQDISNKLVKAENALEARHNSANVTDLIQGFQGEDIKKLVTDTLEKASIALEGTTKVNKWILICGLLLVIASFAITCFTQQWEIMTFGGIGIAGIIASLITNPIKSIGASARQIIQLQIAYIGFLKQLTLLDVPTKLKGHQAPPVAFQILLHQVGKLDQSDDHPDDRWKDSLR